MRPKFNREDCAAIRAVHDQIRPRPTAAQLARRFETNVVTIATVLNEKYVCLEDYLDKQNVMCTRCGSLLHPSKMSYANHAHLFSPKAYHCPDCMRYCNTHRAQRVARRKSMQTTYLRQTAAALLKHAVVEQMKAGNFEIVVRDRDGQRWLAVVSGENLLGLRDGTGDWIYLATTRRSRARLLELDDQRVMKQGEYNRSQEVER